MPFPKKLCFSYCAYCIIIATIFIHNSIKLKSIKKEACSRIEKAEAIAKNILERQLSFSSLEGRTYWCSHSDTNIIITTWGYANDFWAVGHHSTNINIIVYKNLRTGEEFSEKEKQFLVDSCTTVFDKTQGKLIPPCQHRFSSESHRDVFKLKLEARDGKIYSLEHVSSPLFENPYK